MKEAQEEEERRRQQEQQAKLNKLPAGWANQAAVAPTNAGPTLAEIQAQEAKKKEDQRKAEISSANANTLKSLLGLNAAGVPATGVPAAGGSGWKTDAVKPVSGKPSLKDIMQSEAQQTIESSKDVPRSSPASWAAKLGAASLGNFSGPPSSQNEEKSSSSSTKPSTGKNTNPVDAWNQKPVEPKSLTPKAGLQGGSKNKVILLHNNY
jgi:hypothetical protein